MSTYICLIVITKIILEGVNMSDLEKEIKILLDEKQYLEVMNYFDFEEPVEQTNYYYANDAIVSNNITIRIREKLGKLKLQFKVPQKIEGSLHVKEEYEQNVDEVSDYISKDEIYGTCGFFCKDDAKLLGNLKTIRRICNKYQYVEIALDKNSYFDVVDYEIEIEYIGEFPQHILDELEKINIYSGKEVIGKNKRFLNEYKKVVANIKR